MPQPHLHPLIAMVMDAPESEPPSPWKRRAVHAVGGLEAVGFSENSDLLLAVSTMGKGLFDCVSGKRIARDSEDDEIDTFGLDAGGIGQLAESRIPVSGLYGGGLAVLTKDGWCAERLTLDWPTDSLLLVPPGSWIYGVLHDKPHEFSKVQECMEVRAWGFSPTGRTLVLATSSDLWIWGRE